ncbi:Major facilitator superfamily and Major facilitator superfamily domain, general substrate transporter-containing protein [Strongyloides ratti]|uniref:Major facilitator superfamily and Major facilitator superfamily domain, general substrate transporter-containing protein n=1 Tax=Strongyloides ratti TaxID=34506 RepID=A0A090KTS0_STRRB|nr:Major facilitator superfamily and Major facilitator superfamily domain, general substrate transporter-containing protein [Strongyloides ratti]CEF60920.1 Major facilitator superfamily and Major facilitator superfamily domain, general substrate transporter-containing protein [Strongyloides ratti]
MPPNTTSMTDSPKNIHNKIHKERLSIDNEIKEIKDDDEEETQWKSIYIGGLLAFSSNVQFSIYIATIWPYLQTLDPHVTEEFFGFVLGSYSISNIIFSPLFGWWSNKIKCIKIPLYIGITCQLTGNTLYFILDKLPYYQKEFMFFARVITGVGWSCVSLLRSYAATASTNKDRSRAVSVISGGLAFGVTIGPALNLLFIGLGYPGVHILFNIYFHIYNMPSFLAIIANGCSLLAVKFFFVEKYVGIHKYEAGKKKDSSLTLPKYDKFAVGIAFISRFVQMFIVSSISTLSPIISMMMFNFTKKQTVTVISYAQGFLGFSAFVVYFLFIFIDIGKYGKFRRNIIIGFGLLITFHLLVYPYSFIYNDSPKVSQYNSKIMTNISSSTELTGCDISKFDWCENLPIISPYLYFISYSLCIGIAFPVVNAAMNTLFSRMLGNRRQGTMQGCLQTCAGFGVLVAPIFSAFMYQTFGPKIIFIHQIILGLIVVTLWIIFHHRMVPLKVNNDKENIIEKS